VYLRGVPGLVALDWRAEIRKRDDVRGKPDRGAGLCIHTCLYVCVCGRKCVFRTRVYMYSMRSSRHPHLTSLYTRDYTRTCIYVYVLSVYPRLHTHVYMCYILYFYIYASSLWLLSNHLECLRGYTFITTLIAELIHSPTCTQLDSLARSHRRTPPPLSLEQAS